MVCVWLCYSHIHMSVKTKQHTQNEESLLPAKADAAAALRRADASEGGSGKNPEPAKRERRDRRPNDRRNGERRYGDRRNDNGERRPYNGERRSYNNDRNNDRKEGGNR